MFEELPARIGAARRCWLAVCRLFTEPVRAASVVVLRRSPERMF